MEETAAALPDEVVIEVLARVADVAELFRCAMACTRWRGLIADCSFLRRRWPQNATHPSFLVGFFTQRQRCYGIEGNEDEDVADCNSPPVFIPAPRSVLGPGLRSLPEGLLDGAKPLIARRGLLLVHLAPIHPSSPVRLAVCDLLARTCDLLPPLWDHQSSHMSYAILTGEDFGSSEGHKPRTPAPGYSTFFKVLAMSFVRDVYRGVVEYRMRTFSSADAERGWRFGKDRRCCGLECWLSPQDGAAVCHRGIALWLCGDWWSSDMYFTIGVSPKDGHVSLEKLSFLAIQPTAEIYHLATDVDGTLSLFLLYTGKKSLLLDTWTWGDDTHWHRARVTKLKPPRHKRIERVLYFWSGEKSGTLFIIDSNQYKYIVYLETGAMEEISSQFHGMVVGGDIVPMEIDWPALFMSRLAGRSGPELEIRAGDVKTQKNLHQCQNL